jgi:hypothetical protein
MPNPTFFIEDATVATRAAEVPLADFDAGCNLAGSCAPGLGVNALGGAIVGTPEQFTLEDQHEIARTPQTSQHIGGDGLGDGTSGTLPDGSLRFGVVSVSGDGGIPGTQDNATLTTLNAGWVAGV